MGSMAQFSIIEGERQQLKAKQLHRIFEDRLKSCSNQVALIYDKQENSHISELDEKRQTSYSNMNQMANKFARLLVDEAIRRHTPVNTDGDYIFAVCMQPSDHLITTLLAIWKSGAAYLPIDPSFPESRIQHILQEAQPLMLLHDDDIDVTHFGNTATLNIMELLCKSSTFHTTNLRSIEMLGAGEKNLAIVLYTSGSTGVPKGVRLPHAVILNRLQWQWGRFPYSAVETVCVFKTALTFVDSIAELWSPLLNGLSVLVVPKIVTKDPEQLVDILERYQIRRLVLVPTLLHSILMYLNLKDNSQLLKPVEKSLHNLRLWVCSGEPLPLQLAVSFFDYFQEGVHKLFNFYGSTEVMGDVTYFTCKSKTQLSSYERVPIGIPVSNTIIYLLDANHKPVKQGEIGELFVGGANLADGYVNGRDQERFVSNQLAVQCGAYSRLYCTGDYGSLKDGELFYEGRTDSQIKIRGHRVDLSEVEKCTNELPIVDKAVVLCYHPGQVDQALLAFVKLHNDSSLITELQLEAKLKAKLAEYMSPQVVLIDKVPLLVNGKVDRQTLLMWYETANNNDGDSSIVLDYDYSQVPEALQSTARVLFETVGGVIGRSTRTTLTPHCNFYELGGNSLNSIFTVTLLREKGYNIGISEFIAAKNLGEVLAKMSIKGHSMQPSSGSQAYEDLISACPHLSMEAIPLNSTHRNDVIEIIVDSFYGKADLEMWLKPDILRSDYKDIINAIWSDLLANNLSFVVRDRNTNQIIGTALNFDARNEPEVDVKSKLIIVFEFLEFVEGPIRDGQLPSGLNQILHSFMMGTAADLTAQENIAIMNFMEKEVLNVAKMKGFAGILTTNTSPLTQQLGDDVYHYKTLLDYQVNSYVYLDGSRPFAKAPDTQRAIVHWKEVNSA